MRKKEAWMKKGNAVLALGKPGVITKVVDCELNAGWYVYNIYVRLNGAKHAGNYHESDVTELKPE